MIRKMHQLTFSLWPWILVDVPLFKSKVDSSPLFSCLSWLCDLLMVLVYDCIFSISKHLDKSWSFQYNLLKYFQFVGGKILGINSTFIGCDKLLLLNCYPKYSNSFCMKKLFQKLVFKRLSSSLCSTFSMFLRLSSSSSPSLYKKKYIINLD